MVFNGGNLSDLGEEDKNEFEQKLRALFPQIRDYIVRIILSQGSVRVNIILQNNSITRNEVIGLTIPGAPGFISNENQLTITVNGTEFTCNKVMSNLQSLGDNKSTSFTEIVDIDMGPQTYFTI